MWFSLIDSRGIEESSLKTAVEQSQPLSWGLWTPGNGAFPKLKVESLKRFSEMSYQELVFAILWSFDWGISRQELKGVISQAYGNQWRHPDITPVRQMGNDNLFSLHLGYGPTFAFKNVALEFLPRVLAAMTKGKVLHVLWASSGDTINAAHNGVKGTSIRSLFMLPNTGPSEVQRLQAVNGIVENPNAFTLLADVPFDPLQDVVKKVNSREFIDFKNEHNITSFNSINIARILAQVVYYFRGYTQLIKMGKMKAGDPVDFSVPSGNFWDALAGLYAREMWLPIRHINVATNENDMLHKFLQTGRYEPPKRDGKDFVQVTNAPSQDIAKSSNFERALFWATWGDTRKIKKWYTDLSQDGYFQVDQPTLAKLQDVFTSSTSTDEERTNIIKHFWEKYNHGVDPHTATGLVNVYYRWVSGKVPTIFLETSHIAQFGSELRSQGIIVPWMDEFDETLEALRGKNPVEGEHYLRSDGSFGDIFEKIKKAIAILDSRK